MRRIQKITNKRKRITKEAMDTLRDVRKSVDPDVLKKAQEFAHENLETLMKDIKAQKESEKKSENAPESTSNKSTSDSVNKADTGDENVPINREKNLQTVLKVMRLATITPEMQKKIQKELISAIKGTTKH